ncbi:MAG: AbrB/MazE/SpoVT family DNA-binding domain-containing protein [Deltaproteobacteria bacterium]|nr:AbrB/MazE/SpoVT family DNA-binding domain-containing protein [Deltaproteobacteria bacterium]
MRITAKGQVTIPLHIREQLRLQPDTEVVFAIDGNAVRITRAKQQSNKRGKQLLKRLRGSASTNMTTEQIMALTRGKS